jgi:DNA polymerase-2
MARATNVRGFILQPTYRIESGRPVVHLFGKLEDGRSFLVRDGREGPHFFIRTLDAERAWKLGVRPLVATDRVTLEGEPVVRVEVATPADAPPLRDRLIAEGIPCHEADVRFAVRFLIDRGIRGSLEIRGDARPGRGTDVVFDEPEIAPSEWTPKLDVLSIDIETDPRARRLLSIALHGCGASEVLLVTPDGADCPGGALPFATERDLLVAFMERVRELDPDVLTGWNVIEFDLAVLVKLAGRLGLQMEIGRGPGASHVRGPRNRRELPRITVPGRLVLDGIQMLRGTFVRFDDYSLDAVAREVLGEGKTITGNHRAEEILRLFHEDRTRLVEYNLTDARLVLEILDRLRLVELAVERSRLTGLPPDGVTGSIASFDYLYLSELARRNVVAPTVGSVDDEDEPTTGGHVLDPIPGLHDNVLVLDFRSLYPSVIRTFQIDPLGYRKEPSPEEDLIVAPNGATFRRTRGVLTGILDALFPQREEARRTGNWVKSQAIKILMNSFYGVLGTPACRFHNAAVANAITSFGRTILLWTKARIEERGHRVLYGDTDSLFVESDRADPAEARALGAELVAGLNRDIAGWIRERWGVESRLDLEFEKLYLRLLLPTMRHAAAGARKRYAGLVDEDGEPRLVFTGMEVVRRDWTDLARRIQRELYERLFFARPVDDYLRRIVADVRAGRLDDLLVYRKGLRKRPQDYTATTPPHVAAARKMRSRPGRFVEYVITEAGPEPVEERTNRIDYKHYIEKQIRPVAEPVLSLLGLEFGQVVGDDRQLRLF